MGSDSIASEPPALARIHYDIKKDDAGLSLSSTRKGKGEGDVFLRVTMTLQFTATLTLVVLFTAGTSLHCSYLLQASGAVLNFHRQADQHAEFFAFIGQLQDLYQHIQSIVLIPKETVYSNFSR